MKQEFDLEEEWLGMEIHPETPPEGQEMGGRFSPEMVSRLYQNLQESGKPYGIKFNQPPKLSNTHLALLLAEYAKGTPHFDKLHRALFKAYFEDCRDIGQREVLTDLALQAGLTKEEAEAAWQNQENEINLQNINRRALQEGATGTPTFIINDRYRIVGAQPYEVFSEALAKIALEMDGGE